MKFKKVNVSEQYYENGKIGSVPIRNFEEYRTLYGKVMDEGKLDQFTKIGGDNREIFKRLFGKESFRWVWGKTFYCWVGEVGGATILLLVNKEVGTRIEVVKSIDGKAVPFDINVAISFLEDLYPKIK